MMSVGIPFCDSASSGPTGVSPCTLKRLLSSHFIHLSLLVSVYSHLVLAMIINSAMRHLVFLIHISVGQHISGPEGIGLGTFGDATRKSSDG